MKVNYFCSALTHFEDRCQKAIHKPGAVRAGQVIVVVSSVAHLCEGLREACLFDAGRGLAMFPVLDLPLDEENLAARAKSR